MRNFIIVQMTCNLISMLTVQWLALILKSGMMREHTVSIRHLPTVLQRNINLTGPGSNSNDVIFLESSAQCMPLQNVFPV